MVGWSRFEATALLTARFEVDQVWKGEVHERIDVTTHLDGAACGYWLDEGDAMLVYAYFRDGTLSTDVCTRTVSLERAEEADIGALGPGSPPIDGHADPGGGEGLSGAWWMTGAGALGLALVVAGAAVRRAGRR